MEFYLGILFCLMLKHSSVQFCMCSDLMSIVASLCYLNFQVNYALGALYYLCSPANEEEILKPEVVEVIKKYAAAGAVSVSFSNLANAFLEKYLLDLT